MKYQIMEVDNNHLKKRGNHYDGDERRVCFVEVSLDGFNSSLCDSFEEAVEMIEREGKDYTEYTIIPRIYKTNH